MDADIIEKQNGKCRGGGVAAQGAHAAGVWLSAARRKPRTTHFLTRDLEPNVRDEGSGEPPEPARGPRTIPIPVSESGFSEAGSPSR